LPIYVLVISLQVGQKFGGFKSPDLTLDTALLSLKSQDIRLFEEEIIRLSIIVSTSVSVSPPPQKNTHLTDIYSRQFNSDENFPRTITLNNSTRKIEMKKRN